MTASAEATTTQRNSQQLTAIEANQQATRGTLHQIIAQLNVVTFNASDAGRGNQGYQAQGYQGGRGQGLAPGRGGGRGFGRPQGYVRNVLRQSTSSNQRHMIPDYYEVPFGVPPYDTPHSIVENAAYAFSPAWHAIAINT